MHWKYLSVALTLSLLGQDELVFRSSSLFVTVDAQVLMDELPVMGLRRDDFRVWDNGQPQTITSFGTEDQPLDVILLLDRSQSTGEIQKSIQSSATAAMAQLLPNDRLGLVTFADQPVVASPLTLDREKVKTEIQHVPAGRGGTELNDTVRLTAKYLREHARPGARRAIVMLTDNRGYTNVTDQEVRTELWQSNVVFNLLLFKGGSSRTHADVRQFTKETGGEVMEFKATGVPLAELFKRLRHRYYFLYAEPKGQPGELHELRVELSPEAKKRFRKAQVRARRGYVAAGAAASSLNSKSK